MEAKKIQKEKGDSGPLQPQHIHESIRKISKQNPNMKVLKTPPWNKRI
ncbi:TFIID [Hepatospora eriocheir]|nr:TFIID [Hepatospora eriocheir]